MQSNTQLFFLDKRSQFHLDTISKISSDQPEARLIVVDVGAFDYPLQAPWRVPAIFGSGSKSISKMFETLGVEYVDASRITNCPLLEPGRTAQNGFGSEIHDDQLVQEKKRT